LILFAPVQEQRFIARAKDTPDTLTFSHTVPEIF